MIMMGKCLGMEVNVYGLVTESHEFKVGQGKDSIVNKTEVDLEVIGVVRGNAKDGTVLASLGLEVFENVIQSDIGFGSTYTRCDFGPLSSRQIINRCVNGETNGYTFGKEPVKVFPANRRSGPKNRHGGSACDPKGATKDEDV